MKYLCYASIGTQNNSISYCMCNSHALCHTCEKVGLMAKKVDKLVNCSMKALHGPLWQLSIKYFNKIHYTMHNDHCTETEYISSAKYLLTYSKHWFC